ncbi:ATP-binding protein [Streptomyces sp. NPDC052701]|uniref:ATP-binding protein n=1 Tax=Streptomyces sp. NPDC052701 TaxID=3155533 RepID=UPI0034457622
MTAAVSDALHTVALSEWPAPAPGLVVSERDKGFHAVLTASPEAFSVVRALTRSVPTRYGPGPDLGETAELVVSELMGNAVRASTEGPVPLIVEVYATSPGIEVIVHDAVPGQPTRRDVALDSTEAMSGRGLHLLDLLTERWTVEPSPLGKQIRCHLGCLPS